MARKTAQEKTVDETVKENVTETVSEPKTKTVRKKAKPKLVLKDDDSLLIKSKVIGRLIFINDRTQDKYIWNSLNEVQELYVSDIKVMRSRQPAFFEKGWISIDGIAYDEVGYTREEIYKALQLNRYYTNDIENLEDLIAGDISVLKEHIQDLGEDFKRTVIVTAKDMVKAGKLDSVTVIGNLEEMLDTSLIAER